MLIWARRLLVAIGIAGAGALAYFGMRGLGEALDEKGAPVEAHRPKIVGIAAAPIPPVPSRPALGASGEPEESGSPAAAAGAPVSSGTQVGLVEGTTDTSASSGGEGATPPEEGGSPPAPLPDPPKEDPPIDYYPGQ